MKKVYDILIFGGQSNMQGHTECLPEPNDPVGGALEYRYLTDELVPLCHPVGEDISGDLVWRAGKGHGSLVPACCRAYVELTGREVIAIHAAKGNSMVSEWQKGTDRYDCALRKYLGCFEKVKKVGEIGRVYYLWLQGESDAIDHTSEAVYKERLTAYKNGLKEDVGIDRFGIIEVGYFSPAATWVDWSAEEGFACDEEIIKAQENLPGEDPDFVLLTRVCKDLSLRPKYINPDAPGHYNNLAMEIIGTEAGKALAELK